MNKKYQPVPVDTAKTIAEKYNKSIVITPQETWKERWNRFAQINDFYLRGVPMGKLEAFISTELAAARADEAERCALHEEGAKEEGRKEERERGKQVVFLILPLAKGYAHQHDVGSNNRYIEIAENYLATPQDI